MEKEFPHKAGKKKRVKRRNSSQKKKDIGLSTEGGVDVSEALFPIAHYINDREEMIKQIFSVMEKEKLNCMLPPILKGISIKSLMDLCLKELKNMTDDEVLRVLQGEVLETTLNKISPAALLKSKPEASVPSSKKVFDAEEERKTLLEILEQEMQEIAYNTVLNQDQNSSTSEDELPQILAISQSKKENAVPLICIDSEDEGSAASAEIIEQQDSSSEDEYEVIDIEDSIDKKHDHPTPSPKVSMCEDVKLTTFEDVEGLASTSGAKCNIEPSTNSRNRKVQENFVIQVFSKKETYSERVVKKIPCKPPFLDENINRSNECQRAINVEGHLEELVKVMSSLPQASITVNDEKLTVMGSQEDLKSHGSNILADNLVSQAVSDLQSSILPDCNSILHAHLQCSNLSDKCQIKESASENQSKPEEDAEKEEGEISEEEPNEVEVLQVPQSPTVCLSSDENEEEKPDSGANVRKHHKHRHRKRHSESPEQPSRHIDRRGNRSYRRKKSASEKKGLSRESCLFPKEDRLSSPSKDLGEEPSKPSNKSSSQVCSGSIPITNTPDESISRVSGYSDSKEQIEKEKEDIQNAEIVDDVLANLENGPLVNEEDSADEGEPVDNTEVSSSKSSWADRWAQKKDMKKVVITSKICRNVRKRILSARKKVAEEEKPSVEPPVLPPVPPLVLHVEGSVQEYEMLQCLVSDVKDTEAQTQALSELDTINLPPDSGVQENQIDAMKSVVFAGSELDGISLPPTPIKNNSIKTVDVIKSSSKNQDELNANSALGGVLD